MSVTISWREDRKRWQVTYMLDGVRKRPLFLEKPEAESFARKIRLGLAPEDRDSITIDEAGKKYYAAFSIKKSPKSRANDKRYINLHFHFMTYERGIEKLATVTLEDMEAFRDWLPALTKEPWDEGPKSMCMGPSTVNRCLRVLKHFYRRHVYWKAIAESPCTYLDFLDEEEQERAAMTSAQYLSTLAKAPDWLKPTLQFMYLTGSPAICVERIMWDDVSLERKQYSIVRKKGRAAKTKRTFFEMTDSVFALFAMLRNANPNQEGAVFRDSEGRRLLADRVTRIGNDAIRMAKIEGVNLYGLRHALASDLTAANVATEIVRQVMGHASITTTQRYANKVGLRSIAGAIESVRGGKVVAKGDSEARTKNEEKVI